MVTLRSHCLDKLDSWLFKDDMYLYVKKIKLTNEEIFDLTGKSWETLRRGDEKGSISVYYMGIPIEERK